MQEHIDALYITIASNCFELSLEEPHSWESSTFLDVFQNHYCWYNNNKFYQFFIDHNWEDLLIPTSEALHIPSSKN